MCRKPGNIEGTHMTSPASKCATGNELTGRGRGYLPHSPPTSHHIWDLLPSSLLRWSSMNLTTVGRSLAHGGTPSSSACTRCVRVFIQDTTIPSARNRSTNNVFIKKGLKAPKGTFQPTLEAGSLPNMSHPATSHQGLSRVAL